MSRQTGYHDCMNVALDTLCFICSWPPPLSGTCHLRVTRISLTGPNCRHEGFLLSLDGSVVRVSLRSSSLFCASRRPPFHFQLFPRMGSAYRAYMFTVRLHALLSTLGASPASYSGHSFRRGGASFALECGLPIELIEAQVDWVSNAYELYASPSLPMRKYLAATLGKRISAFLG